MKSRSIVAILFAATWVATVATPALEPTLRSSEERTGSKRISLFEGGKELATINVPERISVTSIRDAIRNALWSPTKRAVALVFQNNLQSFVVVFVQASNGRFTAIDVSAVEAGNLSKTGIKPRNLRRIQTKPLRWLDRNDARFQVLIETKVWDTSGKVMTVSEPLLIEGNGTPLFR
jgi:hypothetical protein